MQFLFQMSIETAETFFKTCLEVSKELGRELTQEEREIIFHRLMEIEGIKPQGTELTKEEIWAELVKNGQSILNVDSDGYKIIKKIYKATL